MKIIVDRKWKRDKYTISNFIIDGEKFCNCIEDTDRGLDSSMSVEEISKKKVYGETAIPRGSYKVIMSMSNKYKKMMPEILGVKGFSGIRIHSGNSEKDSLGCLILGKNDKVGWVSNSRYYCSQFYDRLQNVLSKGEEVIITIL